MPAHLNFMVRESYNWFSYSPKRLLQYRELHKCIMDEVPLKLRQVSATRWMSRYECIGRIIDQWDALKLCFQMASSDEKCYTARQLFSMFEDDKNYLYLIFLEGTLKDFSRINKLFELADADVVRLGTDLMNFYSLLQRIVVPSKLEKVNRRDLFSYNFKNDLMPESCAHLGYAFISNAERLKIPQQDVAEVKKRCFTFLVEAATQVHMRLPQNVIVFQDISLNEVLKVQELTRLATRFPNIVHDVDSLNKEIRQLKLLDIPEDLAKDPVKFWDVINGYKDTAGELCFRNLSQLALSLYSIPYSNAEVERIFSKMNYFKNKMRNRMSSPTLDALIRIEGGLRWRKKECHNFTVTDDMKSKFNTSTVYQISKDDDILPDIDHC